LCGTAEVMRGETSYLVSENESIFIPLTRHRLENPAAFCLK
jgi:mannose-1-phosphate guanylyltransferase/mannose-6-phosphate isomerase